MELKRVQIYFLLLVVLTMLFPAPKVYAQTESPPSEVLDLMESLTPEERVGQLFLVTFTGTDTDIESPIYDLIANYHIGGVVLQAENDNFISSPSTVSATHQLISDIQNIEWDSTISPISVPEPDTLIERAYVPLFVGIEQDGNGFPSDQILSDLTAIPNAMSLGATWKPELAQQIGEIQGSELAALGINLYIGPSLDVLETPSQAAQSDIGTGTFGGDPYWVAEMGSAFINGLHTGSDGHMLVIAKHFPGLGSSDRSADEEVATVRKSLEQLKQIELAPFFAVTGNAPDALSTTDGLLVSHIRFQGLQGNIRATTRPVSFDQNALGEILALQQLSDWHVNGGLIVSDNLGSRAVRIFYAPANEGFSAELVARDVFQAGNDLLYLGNITSSNAEDAYATTVDVLEFFAQRYREDSAFAQLVDEAVLRILTRKHQLFGRFLISDVITPVNALAEVGVAQQTVFDVARYSATLINPDIQELTSLFPSPPALRDRMVFITDTAQYVQCSNCPVMFSLSVNALQDAIVRLYGPNAGGQVSEARLDSYTIDDLAALLSEADVETMVSNISRANWIVLSLSDASRGQPELISRFLSERQDLLREKHIVLFSFTAPYYLDATDISKLSAYYSLYSKQPAFVDVAVRLLYQELTPLGFSPISVPGINYDLIEITRPDPDQIIILSLDFPPVSVPTITPTPVTLFSTQTSVPTTLPEPTAIPLFRSGETVNVQTGVILDHNGHLVPDGTVVRFTMLLSGEGGGIIQQADQITAGGIARTSFSLEKTGLVEISASSDPATLSDVIQIDVSQGDVEAVTVVAPNPSETVEPTQIPSTPIEGNIFVTDTGFPRPNTWLLTMILIALGSGLAYWAGSSLQSTRWGWRWGLCVFLGGLAGYNYAALGLPGGTQLVLASGLGGIFGLTTFGGVIGLGVAWLWSRQS